MTQEAQDRFLYLSSDDSEAFYPDNKPNHFTVKLPGTLKLPGQWECALTEVVYHTEFNSPRPQSLYICSDIVQVSYGCDALLPILRKVAVPASLNMKAILSFPQNFYIPMAQEELQYITIYIKDEILEDPSFEIGPFNCSLHLRRIS